MHLIGRVGDDAAGRAVAEELAAAGVAGAPQVDPALGTGTCVVLVEPGGERSMLPDAGANAALAAVPLPQGAAHLHVAGYALLHPGSRPAALALLAAARAAGVPVSVDPSSAAPLGRARRRSSSGSPARTCSCPTGRRPRCWRARTTPRPRPAR